MEQRQGKVAGSGRPAEKTLGSALERICFLEWRLEQMESVLADERRTVRDLREQLAEAATRESEGARRIAALEERLADAKREMVALGDRTAHADAERTALERRMESSGRETAKEIAQLCRKLEHEQTRAETQMRALEHARERVASLERARESFFARLIEWQQLARADDVDLAEFIAELRSEIMTLAARNEEAAVREEQLLEQIERAEIPEEEGAEVVTPLFLAAAPEPSERPRRTAPAAHGIGLDEARSALDGIPGEARRQRAQRLAGELTTPKKETRLGAARALVEAAGKHAAPALVATLRLAAENDERIALLALLGKTGEARVADAAIASVLEDPDPYVRAAALEAGVQLFGDAPERIRQLAEVGLTDADARVRRRTILALKARVRDSVVLLVPLIEDEDPQTRRAVCAALAGETGPAARRALLAALSDDAPPVRRAAARALAGSVGQDVTRIVELPDLARRRAISNLKQRLMEGEREVRDGAR